MRPPGGWTVDMWNYANDIDMYREWANVVVHGRFDAPVTRPYNVLYASRRDHRPLRDVARRRDARVSAT